MSHSGHRGQTTTLSNPVPVRRFLQETVKKINDLRNVTFQQASGGRRTTLSPERLRLRKERTRTGGAGERAARPFGGSSHSQVGGAGSEASTRLTLKRLACRDGKPKRDTWPQNCSVTQQARDEGRRAPGPCGQLPRRLPASTHSHAPVTAASHPLRPLCDGLYTPTTWVPETGTACCFSRNRVPAPPLLAPVTDSAVGVISLHTKSPFPSNS